jgi:hypothetical protein
MTVPDFSTCAHTGELDDLEGYTTTSERVPMWQVLLVLSCGLSVPLVAGVVARAVL